MGMNVIDGVWTRRVMGALAAGFAVKLAVVLLIFGTTAGASTRANAPGLPHGFSPLAVDYDPVLELFVARGSFAILRDQRIIVSDQLVYNPRSDLVYASGDLRLRTLGGDRPLANPVVLHGEVKRAFAAMARDIRRTRRSQEALARRRQMGNMVAGLMDREVRNLRRGTPTIASTPPAPVRAKAAVSVPPDVADLIQRARARVSDSRGPATPATGQPGPESREQRLPRDVYRRMRADIERGFERALERAPNVSALTDERRAAQLGVEAERLRGIAPRVDFIGDARGGQTNSRNADQTFAGSPGVSTRGSLRLSMPLYDGGEQDARKDIAAVRVDEVDIDRRANRADLVADVRQVVWDWHVAHSHHELAQEWYPAYQTWLKQAHELFVERLITSETLLQAVSIDARFREELAVFESDRKSALARWQELTGEAQLTPASGSWPRLPEPPAPDGVLQMIAESADVLRAQLDVRSLRHELDLQKSRDSARLSLEAQADGRLPGADSYFAGVRLVVPLSDGGVNRTRTSAVRSRLDAAVHRLSAAQQTLRLNVTKANAELHRLREREATATATISAALTRLEHRKELYENLPTEIGQVISAANNFLTAIRGRHDTSSRYFQTYNAMLRDLSVAEAGLPDSAI